MGTRFENMDEIFKCPTLQVVNLYEVSYRVRQIRDKETAGEMITSISSHATIHLVDQDVALAAAPLRLVHGYGVVDALYHATAHIHTLTMPTGDLHFKGIEGAIPV